MNKDTVSGPALVYSSSFSLSFHRHRVHPARSHGCGRARIRTRPLLCAPPALPATAAVMDDGQENGEDTPIVCYAMFP